MVGKVQESIIFHKRIPSEAEKYAENEQREKNRSPRRRRLEAGKLHELLTAVLPCLTSKWQLLVMRHKGSKGLDDETKKILNFLHLREVELSEPLSSTFRPDTLARSIARV